MACSLRTYPLKRPEGHQPPVPRWRLVCEPAVTHVHVAYIGVQQHDNADSSEQASDQATKSIEEWASKGDTKAPAIERFDLIDGNDAKKARVWVCYWADEEAYNSSLRGLSLTELHASLTQSGRSSVGLWLETFSLPASRLETNYTGLDYLPGFAQLSGTTTEPHTLTAYWGAARDRIAASAHDLFPGQADARPLKERPDGLGLRLTGTNADNLVHIRTGQYWQECDEEESTSYERKLEPTLEAGLRYLWDNPEMGAMGLRYVRNYGIGEKEKRKETCAAGFFTSLDKLEGWAKSHKSHLAIYNGAMKHAKVFGPERKLRTWHEVVVLKKGEAKLEYVNCVGDTGLIKYFDLAEEALDARSS